MLKGKSKVRRALEKPGREVKGWRGPWGTQNVKRREAIRSPGRHTFMIDHDGDYTV